MTFLLPPGQRHEATMFDQLMASSAVKRIGPGRPKRRPHRVVGDKGYRSRKSRQYLTRHQIRLTIPRKNHDGRTGPFNRASYRGRNRGERLINRYKQFRPLAARYEKRAEYYRARWLLATILLWL
jgi:transposase